MDTALLISLIAIGVLLLFSGFFSGSETALTAASRVRIATLERQGNRRAKIVAKLLLARERLIGAILLGNNLVNIWASAIATGLLIGWFGDAGIAYATIIMTTLILVFAEVLPKTYALRHPDRTALRVAPLIRVVVIVFSPIVRLLQGIVGITFRIFGAEKGVQGHFLSPEEEIRSTIQLHAEEGGIIKHESDMLHSIFDLSDVEVSEIMVHRKSMMMLDVTQPTANVVDEILASPFTRVPIWRDEPENIVGIIHAKDLLRALAEAKGNVDSLDLAGIAMEPWFVPESTRLVEQLTAFRARHSHFALVVDEYGALMGAPRRAISDRQRALNTDPNAVVVILLNRAVELALFVVPSPLPVA